MGRSITQSQDRDAQFQALLLSRDSLDPSRNIKSSAVQPYNHGISKKHSTNFLSRMVKPGMDPALQHKVCSSLQCSWDHMRNLISTCPASALKPGIVLKPHESSVQSHADAHGPGTCPPPAAAPAPKVLAKKWPQLCPTFR